MEASAQAKVLQVLDRLEKQYGKFKHPRLESRLELAVFLLLREGWDHKKASKVLKLIKDEFVDWNEVRVTTTGQLRAMFHHHIDDPKLEERFDAMFCLLDQVYRDWFVCSFDRLDDMTMDERKEFLMSFEALSVAQVYVILQTMAEEDQLLMSYHGLRLGSRIGLIPKTTSIPAGTKSYLKVLPENEWIRFQSLAVAHADTVCQPKNFKCERCVLNTMCQSAKTVQTA